MNFLQRRSVFSTGYSKVTLRNGKKNKWQAIGIIFEKKHYELFITPNNFINSLIYALIACIKSEKIDQRNISTFSIKLSCPSGDLA